MRNRLMLAISTGLAMWGAGLSAPATGWGAGIFNYENGSPIIGMAGAGYAALAQDASTAFTNPAGMTQLKKSEVFVGFQPYYADSRFQIGPGTNVPGGGGNGGNYGQGLQGNGGLFGVYSWSERLKFGLALNSYFAGSGTYESTWVGRYYNQSSSLISASITPSVAYQFAEWISFGAGVNIMEAQYSSQVAVHNHVLGVTDAPDGQISGSAYNTGVGANLGVLLTPRQGTRIGVNWLSQVNLAFKTVPHCTGIVAGGGHVLGDALTQGLCAHETNLGQKVPQQVMVSGYQAITQDFALVVNVGWQQWSKNGQVSFTAGDTVSGTANLNYKDTYHLALGAQYKLTPIWMVMGGLSYDSSPADVGNRSVAAPYDQMWRYGLGTMYTHSEHLSFGGSFEFINIGPSSLTQTGSAFERGTVSGSYSPNLAYVVGLYGRWIF